MTTLQSKIHLGWKYVDHRTKIEGFANSIHFNENGCVEVGLEMVKDGETKTQFFSQHRLTRIPSDVMAVVKDPMIDYETDIEFGTKYYDTQTGIEGHPGAIAFYEAMATRVELRGKGKDREGNAKIIYHSIDDFLLAPVGTTERARRRDEKPSPMTRQIEGR